MSRVADYWQTAFEAGNAVRLTTQLGTDLTASIKGQPSHRSNFAHTPGRMSPINWGEVYQGPVVGTTNGRAVIDGPVLGFGWPKEPLVLEISDGLVTGISGDADVSAALWKLI